MADFKQNYFQRRTKDRGPRSNNRISSPDVQVIASDGENLGVISTNEAISMAKNQGLDLIEIAPNANPPVCKIMILQTGGFALGAISIKSKPWFFAIDMASLVLITPRFSPSLAIT